MPITEEWLRTRISSCQQGHDMSSSVLAASSFLGQKAAYERVLETLQERPTITHKLDLRLKDILVNGAS